MLTRGKIRWLRRLGLAMVAAAGLGTIGIGAPAPAQAQWYNPYYPYYPYYSSSPQPRWNPGYGPGWRRCGPGWHFERGHWDRWGRWVSPGCRRDWR
jgi:hypothetical protein